MYPCDLFVRTQLQQYPFAEDSELVRAAFQSVLAASLLPRSTAVQKTKARDASAGGSDETAMIGFAWDVLDAGPDSLGAQTARAQAIVGQLETCLEQGRKSGAVPRTVIMMEQRYGLVCMGSTGSRQNKTCDMCVLAASGVPCEPCNRRCACCVAGDTHVGVFCACVRLRVRAVLVGSSCWR